MHCIPGAVPERGRHDEHGVHGQPYCGDAAELGRAALYCVPAAPATRSIDMELRFLTVFRSDRAVSSLSTER